MVAIAKHEKVLDWSLCVFIAALTSGFPRRKLKEKVKWLCQDYLWEQHSVDIQHLTLSPMLFPSPGL